MKNYFFTLEGDKAHRKNNPSDIGESDIDAVYQKIKTYQNALNTINTAFSRAVESQASG